jgi:hypothetical protein
VIMRPSPEPAPVTTATFSVVMDPERRTTVR